MNILKVVLAVLTLLILFSQSSAEEVWRITSLNWQPYSGDELTTQGNSIQRLRELLKRHDIRLIVEFYPWKRAQLRAKSEEFIGYYPAWPEEVAEGFVASRPVDWSEIAILKREGVEISYESIDDLFRKYEVGMVRTYVYPYEIDAAMKKYSAHVNSSSSDTSMLKKLSAGRHDVAITDPNVMMYLAERFGIDNVELVEILMKKELVLALRDDKENKKRMELLDKILSEAEKGQ